MKCIIPLLFSLIAFSVYGQDVEYFDVKKNIKEVVLTPADNSNIDMYEMTGIFKSAKKISYADAENEFSVAVPKWLHLKETNDLNYFGGTLPETNNSKNAIGIISIRKDKYRSFKDFRNYVIEDTGYRPNTNPKWSNEKTFISIAKDSLSKNGYYNYKLSTNKNGNISVVYFTLAETRTAFLWIQFISTEETFDINFPKFKEFMKGFRIQQIPKSSLAEVPAATTYTNRVYHFKASIPGDWELYNQIINDTTSRVALADWGLPRVYSELEKSNIENAVSITAYQRKDIQNMEQLISFEKRRLNSFLSDLVFDEAANNAVIITYSMKKLGYKGKSYFIFKNDTGYIVTFMATPGTYDKNLEKFEAFYRTVVFE